MHDLTGTPHAERLLSVPPFVHPRSSQVLPRLRQFNPELTAKFQEKDDAIKQIPFKLITTQASWTPREIESFVAISYCWHSGYWEVPRHFSLGESNWEFPLSPAMLKAGLVKWDAGPRPTSQFAIWIDQICINQKDADEKSKVIANMDMIYRNASEVGVLLEDLHITAEAESVLRLLHSGAGDACSTDPLNLEKESIRENLKAGVDDYGLTSISEFLLAVYDSRWFKRAWCRHEYMLNKNVIFVCCGQVCPCITFDQGALSGLSRKLQQFNDFHGRDANLFSAYEDFSFGIYFASGYLAGKGTLLVVFVQLQLLHCSFIKDIISVSLNTTGIRLSFDGNPGDEGECRAILASIAFGAGDASVLGAAGSPIYSCHGHQPLLYWPVDYMSSWPTSAGYLLPTMNAGTKIRHFTPEKLSLDMLFLLSRPTVCPEGFNDTAVKLIDPVRHPGIRSTDILSCALSFGANWMNMVSASLQEFVRELDACGASTYKNLQSTIEHLQLGDGIILERFVNYLANGRLWFVGFDEDFTVLSVSLNSAGTGWAILLVPPRLSRKVVEGKYRIAVPVALNTIGAFSVLRLWILEDAKTLDSALAIVGRGYIIAERDLDTEVHDAVSYAQEVTVVGEWKDETSSTDHSLTQSLQDGIRAKRKITLKSILKRTLKGRLKRTLRKLFKISKV